MCDRNAANCSVTLPRSDRREIVHMDRWRLLVPATMVECDYVKEEAVAMAKESLETVYPQKVAVAVPPDPTGEAGLDRALAEAKKRPASPA